MSRHTFFMTLALLIAGRTAGAQVCGVDALRSAINTANSSGGTITLAAGCIVSFTSATPGNSDRALPTITGTITIDGNGGSLIRSSASQFRFFNVQPGASLTLKNITVEKGHAPNGPDGIDSQDNESAGTGGQGADGGAIHNRGTLVLDDVIITDSLAGDGGWGGKCASNHNAGFGASGGKGGAIFNASDLTVRNSTLARNRAGEDALNGDLQLRITDSDQSFDVLVPVLGCTRRVSGSIDCRRRGLPNWRLTVIPIPDVTPASFAIRFEASHLSAAQTGPSGTLAGPVTIRLSRSRGETALEIDACRQMSRRLLRCG